MTLLLSSLVFFLSCLSLSPSALCTSPPPTYNVIYSPSRNISLPAAPISVTTNGGSVLYWVSDPALGNGSLLHSVDLLTGLTLPPVELTVAVTPCWYSGCTGSVQVTAVAADQIGGLWFYESSTGFLIRVDPLTGKRLPSSVSGSDGFFTSDGMQGMAVRGADGLVVFTYSIQNIEWFVQSGYVNRFQMDSFSINTLAFDYTGSTLYVMDNTPNPDFQYTYLYAFDPTTLTLKSSTYMAGAPMRSMAVDVLSTLAWVNDDDNVCFLPVNATAAQCSTGGGLTVGSNSITVYGGSNVTVVRGSTLEVWTPTFVPVQYNFTYIVLLTAADGLVVAGDGSMYVASYFGGTSVTILHLTAAGALLNTITLTTPHSQSAVYGLALDATGQYLYAALTWFWIGDVVAAAYSDAQLVKFAVNGTQATQLATYDSSPTWDYGWSIGVTLDGAGRMYVTDVRRSCVVQLDGNGTQLQLFTTVNPALSAPTDVKLDSLSQLYISDWGNNRIVQMSSAGAQLAVLNTCNPALSQPKGLAIDSSDVLYIADTGNSRVVQMTITGVTQSVFTTTDRSLSPLYLYVTAGLLYVTDSTLQSPAVLSRVVVFPTEAGAPLPPCPPPSSSSSAASSTSSFSSSLDSSSSSPPFLSGSAASSSSWSSSTSSLPTASSSTGITDSSTSPSCYPLSCPSSSSSSFSSSSASLSSLPVVLSSTASASSPSSSSSSSPTSLLSSSPPSLSTASAALSSSSSSSLPFSASWSSSLAALSSSSSSSSSVELRSTVTSSARPVAAVWTSLTFVLVLCWSWWVVSE